MKTYDKNKELIYLNDWETNNLYGWAISQKLSVHDLNWVEDISQFTKYFLKDYNDDSNEGYFSRISQKLT